MSNFILFTNKISFLYICILVLKIEGEHQLLNGDFDEYDDDSSATNESLTTPLPTKARNSTTMRFSSKLLATMSTKNLSFSSLSIRTRNYSSTNSLKNQSASSISVASRKMSISSTPLTPYMLVSRLVDQFNHHRTIDILSHIKQCDTKMRLRDMCELYSFDNHTYQLIREGPIDFQTIQQIYQTLLNPLVVEKLSKLCPTGQWCLNNLTRDDIHFTANIVRQHGDTFCLLERCHHRLSIHITSCSFIPARNVHLLTLKLFPMLCTLYREQKSWNSTECTDEIVYLLHLIYAFWPQFEACSNMVTAGSGGCTSECLLFDRHFHNVENRCSKNASFLSRIPALNWFRSANLNETCRHEIVPQKSPFLLSAKNFFSSALVDYKFHQRPIYIILIIAFVILVVTGFSLCLYFISKNDCHSHSRHYDDDYEYTRLHESTFELSGSTEIPNTDSTTTRMINEPNFNSHQHSRLPEQQRLLYMDS